MRGTFGNIRLRNRLVEGKEGPYTVHLPSNEETFIYDAAMRYQREGVPLLVLAGREYGSGSSREHIQRLGRILRKRPGKEAILYEVVATGTTEEHISRRRSGGAEVSTGGRW